MLDEKGFDLWAEAYDESVAASDREGTYPFAGYRELLGTIYRRVREKNGKRVLDIGFGTGTLTRRLYDDGIAVTGIDFSAEMIRIARERMPHARLIQADFSRGLPDALAHEAFDAIVSTYALHHLDDGQKAALIRELRGHLAPGGQILLGDVAFATAEERERCRAESGERWDDQELYGAAEELEQLVPGLDFQKISPCAGIFIIRG